MDSNTAANDTSEFTFPAKEQQIAARRSVTRDLTLVTVTVFILVTGLALFLSLHVVASSTQQSFFQKADDYMLHLKTSLEIPLWTFDRAGVKRVGQAMTANDFVASLTVQDADGKIWFSDSKSDPVNVDHRCQTVKFEDHRVGEIQLGLTPKPYKENQRRMTFMGLGMPLSLILVVIISNALLLRRLLQKPFSELIGRINEVAGGTYKTLKLTIDYHEFLQIWQRVNEMAVRLENREDSLANMNRALKDEIVERERAEHLLRESEERYRTLFNSTADAIFVHPLQEQGFGTFLEVNEIACDRLGYSGEGLLNLSAADISRAEETERRGSRAFREKLEKEGTLIFEAVHVAKSGIKIPVEISSTLFFFKGEKVVMSIARDVSQRKEYEETLRRYERIISATNDLMSFLDTNYIYQAVNNAYLKAHAKRREEIIGFSVAQLMGEEIFHQLVKEHLDRAFSGEVAHYQSWFEYAGMGRRFMDVFYHPFEDGRGDITGVVISAHDITDIKVAEEALQQSEERYRSLVENNFDGYFICEIPSGKFVFLNRRLCDLFHYSMEEGLSLSLIDLVNPEQHERMASLFRKLPEAGEQVSSSHIYNAVGKDGVNFKAEISISMITYEGKQALQGVLRDVTEKRRGNETILLVDDEESIRELGRELLCGFGYTVIPVPDGETALDIYQREKTSFSLIILDLIMPGMGGQKSLRELLRLNPSQRVIVMSGHSLDGSVEEMLQLGRDASVGCKRLHNQTLRAA